MSPPPIRFGLVGYGKIAQDEHVPAIASQRGAELIAVADPHQAADGVPGYVTIDQMLAAHPEVNAVALCQPPGPRFEAARTALLAGKHVLLEKPPCATLSEVELLKGIAAKTGSTLFASWHSRYSPQVEEARAWCATRTISAISIEWKEDVRRWHPDQEWIWEPQGYGVFDPGMNALSIVTAILPNSLRVFDAHLAFPADKFAPIAAEFMMLGANDLPVDALFDWRQTGPQIWNITFRAGDDTFKFHQAAEETPAVASLGRQSSLTPEYEALYRRFLELIAQGTSDVDVEPLRLVADACLIGRRTVVEPFATASKAATTSSVGCSL